MDAFLKPLQTLPEVAELASRVENGGCPAVLTGTQPVQRACVGAAVAAGAGRPMVFLCADDGPIRIRHRFVPESAGIYVPHSRTQSGHKIGRAHV